jgi:hypothetical protein
MSAKSATKALKNPFKIFANVIKGDFKDAAKFAKDTPELIYKASPGYKALSAVEDFIKPKMPDMPTATPESPVAIPETGGDPLDSLRRRRRKGRASTIQAGSLIPEDVGTKSLLG